MSFGYNIFYKSELPISGVWDVSWDVFVSAFNTSDRVRIPFERAPAPHKFWAIHSEYGFDSGELPEGEKYSNNGNSEAIFIKGLVAHLESAVGKALPELKLCIDMTGFMRPHLMFLTLYLKHLGVMRYDVIYSEPILYAKKENTVFSEGAIQVRQVEGFEGVNSTDQQNDFLIIGSGYDDRLIKAVAESKDKADKVQIFGLPSLRADMYQENVMRARNASDAIGTNKLFDDDKFFAPANDPFATAETIHEIVKRRLRVGSISNLYLSPLATKPQAVGFALYYLTECAGGATASILFPISKRYAKETSSGLSRVWRYTIEHPR